MNIMYRAFVLLCFVVASHSCTSGNTDEQGKYSKGRDEWKRILDYNKQVAEKQKGSKIVWQTDYPCNGNCAELERFLDSLIQSEKISNDRIIKY